MWNRVVLLTCGMALGWGLANYWVAPEQDIPKHRYRIGVSLVIAALLSAVLAWEQLSSGIIAISIVALCALVSYAANARQIDKEPPLGNERLVAPFARQETPVVILIACVEPPVYDGPTFWAMYLKRQASEGRRIPHWFVHPWVYHRIRAAYRKMQGGPPSYRTLVEVERALAQRLGGRALVRSVPFYSDGLVQTLRSMAQLGHNTFILVPLDLTMAQMEEIKQAVTRSRIREIGCDAALLPSLEAGIWTPERAAEAFACLVQGAPPPEDYQAPRALVDGLAGRITEMLG